MNIHMFRLHKVLIALYEGVTYSDRVQKMDMRPKLTFFFKTSCLSGAFLISHQTCVWYENCLALAAILEEAVLDAPGTVKLGDRILMA